MSNLVLTRRKKEGIVIHIPELGEIPVSYTHLTLPTNREV